MGGAGLIAGGERWKAGKMEVTLEPGEILAQRKGRKEEGSGPRDAKDGRERRETMFLLEGSRGNARLCLPRRKGKEFTFGVGEKKGDYKWEKGSTPSLSAGLKKRGGGVENNAARIRRRGTNLGVVSRNRKEGAGEGEEREEESKENG